MKLSRSVLLSLLTSCIVKTSAHEPHEYRKRNVQYVTMVMTVQIGISEYLAERSTTQQTFAVPTTSSSGSDSNEGFWEQLFGGDSFSDSSSSSSSNYETPTISTYTQSVFTSSSIPSTSSSGSGAAAYAAKSRGITYSPYTKSGSCKTAAEVQRDFEKLTDFGMIRLYDTDCSVVENVLASISSSQKLFLGIYNIDSSTIINGLQTIKSAVESSSFGWDAVHTISIGNERVNDGKSSTSDILTAVNTARSWLSSNASGYSGYVVNVDTLVAVLSHKELCDVSDYLAVNSHPYWDGGVEPSNSGPWLQQQISNLKSACGNNKDILITETGWPTKGQSYGSCFPSEANQLSAVESIVNTVADQVLIFTMYNDYWKNGGAYGVEQYWGVFGDPDT